MTRDEIEAIAGRLRITRTITDRRGRVEWSELPTLDISRLIRCAMHALTEQSRIDADVARERERA